MAIGDPSNPLDELAALGANLAAATTGVIARPVTVLTDPFDEFYGGTYPLLQIGDSFDWRLERMPSGGGVTGRKGQNPTQPSVYFGTLTDVVDPRAAAGTRVATARNDLLKLVKAIAAYFDVAPHRGLPVDVGGSVVNGATLAGEYLRVRYSGPFREEEGGEIKVVVAFSISVAGIPHLGTLA